VREAAHLMPEGMDVPVPPFALFSNFSKSELEDFLIKSFKSGASDITLQSGDYPWLEIKRNLVPGAERKLEDAEVKKALNFLYNDTGVGKLAKGEDGIDFKTEILVDRNTTYRFRGNATACQVGDIGGGVSITLRTIPGLPPTLDDLGIEQEIRDNLFPREGVIFIVGPTGSGKSTTLAAANRERLTVRSDIETVKILTFEDPIEFVYTGLGEGRMPAPSQVEMGRHMENFYKAGRNAMRRKGHVIIFGEVRDEETAESVFEMALTGHSTYATLHADTPAKTIDRLVALFENDRAAAANKLLSVIRMVVAQKLVRGLDGKVYGLRSWLIFDEALRDHLATIDPSKWSALIDKLTVDRGSDFLSKATTLFKAGRISLDSFRTVTSMSHAEAVKHLGIDEKGGD